MLKSSYENTMRNGKIASVIIVVVSLTFSASIFFFKDIFQENARLGLFGIFIANFISGLSVFVPVPGMLTAVAGGSIYPPILVALAASLGGTLGDMVLFLLGISGRKIGKRKLEKNKKFVKLEDYFKKYGGWLLFVVAFIPNPVFDSFGLIAGIFNFSISRFFGIVFIGRFLRYVILAGIASIYS